MREYGVRVIVNNVRVKRYNNVSGTDGNDYIFETKVMVTVFLTTEEKERNRKVNR